MPAARVRSTRLGLSRSVFNHGSARHVQDRVSSSGLSLQLLDSFRRRQNQQFDFAYFGFAFHFFHDGQVSVAGGKGFVLEVLRSLLYQRVTMETETSPRDCSLPCEPAIGHLDKEL